MLFPEVENRVDESPGRELDGVLAGYWRSKIKHNVDDTWMVSLYRTNRARADSTLTAASFGELVMLAYRADGVDISKTKEPLGPNTRPLAATLRLTRNDIRRRLREGGVEPTPACVEEAVRALKEAARAATQDALVAFIAGMRGNRPGAKRKQRRNGVREEQQRHEGGAMR